MKRVLFVCMGNICRSPTALAVARMHAERAGLSASFEFDSAGTHAYHVGEPPDARSQSAAKLRGYDMSRFRARSVKEQDFVRFDYILAMDRRNLVALHRSCPPEYASKLRLFLEFSEDLEADEVPDPYYGGPAGFDRVLDLCENAAQGLLNKLTEADLR